MRFCFQLFIQSRSFFYTKKKWYEFSSEWINNVIMFIWMRYVGKWLRLLFNVCKNGILGVSALIGPAKHAAADPLVGDYRRFSHPRPQVV